MEGQMSTTTICAVIAIIFCIIVVRAYTRRREW